MASIGSGAQRRHDGRPHPPASLRPVLAMAVGAFGGLALVVSTFLAWPARGAGSSVAAHRIGDLLLSEASRPWLPRWAGLVVYLVPAGGAVLMVASGVQAAAAPWLKLAGLVPAALVTAIVVVTLSKRHPLDLGAGASLALAGTGLGILSLLIDRRPPTAAARAEEHPCTA